MTMEPQKGKKRRKGKGGRGAVGVKAEGKRCLAQRKGYAVGTCKPRANRPRNFQKSDGR